MPPVALSDRRRQRRRTAAAAAAGSVARARVTVSAGTEFVSTSVAHTARGHRRIIPPPVIEIRKYVLFSFKTFFFFVTYYKTALRSPAHVSKIGNFFFFRYYRLSRSRFRRLRPF